MKLFNPKHIKEFREQDLIFSHGHGAPWEYPAVEAGISVLQSRAIHFFSGILLPDQSTHLVTEVLDKVD